ncbi:uncharacterized protein LOC117645864 isoform X2 [Thrips palmi]|nr:uncharacterized protein LOC117645864 isoform X2 [Thrips palmi]
MDPPWALRLLRRVAPYLEELSLVPATRSMLAELHAMPRYRKPGLRRLEAEFFAMAKDEEPVMEIAAPSEPGTGIAWLRAFDLPQNVTELLLRAYGHSLKEVMLSAGASKDADGEEWPVTVATETLVPMMARCGLRVLRRWVRPAHRCAYPDHCRAQRKALQAVLPASCLVLCGGLDCDRRGAHSGEDFDFNF